MITLVVFISTYDYTKQKGQLLLEKGNSLLIVNVTEYVYFMTLKIENRLQCFSLEINKSRWSIIQGEI